MKPVELHGAAVHYAARGWPVLPCKPRGKTPLTEHGLHDATTDPDTIGRWWRKRPDANIGLRTGVCFDVLDIDGDAGVEEFGRLLGDEDTILPGGPIAFTPNRGVHIYFTPTGTGNKAGFRPSLDWRGSGGYVVAPPSIGANGVPYRWWSIEAEPSSEELSPAPGWLVALLARPEPPPRPVARSCQVAPSQGGARAHKYALAALESECQAVARAPEGTRNHQLNVAAFALGRFVADGDLGDAAIERVLLSAARAAGLSEREALPTIRSGLRGRGLS